MRLVRNETILLPVNNILVSHCTVSSRHGRDTPDIVMEGTRPISTT